MIHQWQFISDPLGLLFVENWFNVGDQDVKEVSSRGRSVSESSQLYTATISMILTVGRSALSVTFYSSRKRGWTLLGVAPPREPAVWGPRGGCAKPAGLMVGHRCPRKEASDTQTQRPQFFPAHSLMFSGNYKK